MFSRALGGAALLLLVGLPLHAQSSLVRLLRESMRCSESRVSYQVAPQKECEFRLGRGLRFAVIGVGQPDAAITVYKSDFDGDYYVSIGMLHGCAVVKPTRDAPAAVRGTMAFVSPISGLVYETWEECKAGQRG